MSPTKKYLLLIVKVVVATTLTFLLVRYSSPAKILEALKSADIGLVLTFVPLTLVAMGLAALQLKILTDCHDMKVGFWSIVGINASTEFYSLFLPGILSGGVFRWYRLSRDNKMRAQALAVIAVSRLINTFVMLMLALAGWLLQGDYATAVPEFGFLLLCTFALVSGYLVLSNSRIAATSRRALDGHQKSFPTVREKLLKLINAVAEYRRMSGADVARLVACATGWHLSILCSTYLFCLALSIDVSLATLAWIRAMVSLALMLPITISGFGIREGGWIYFLGLYGVAPADAFVLSLLTFVRTLFQAVIGFVLEIKTLFSFGIEQES